MTRSDAARQKKIVFVKDGKTGAVKEITTVGRILDNRYTYSTSNPTRLSYLLGSYSGQGSSIGAKKKCCGQK